MKINVKLSQHLYMLWVGSIVSYENITRHDEDHTHMLMLLLQKRAHSHGINICAAAWCGG